MDAVLKGSVRIGNNNRRYYSMALSSQDMASLAAQEILPQPTAIFRPRPKPARPPQSGRTNLRRQGAYSGYGDRRASDSENEIGHSLGCRRARTRPRVAPTGREFVAIARWCAH